MFLSEKKVLCIHYHHINFLTKICDHCIHLISPRSIYSLILKILGAWPHKEFPNMLLLSTNYGTGIFEKLPDSCLTSTIPKTFVRNSERQIFEIDLFGRHRGNFMAKIRFGPSDICHIFHTSCLTGLNHSQPIALIPHHSHA